MALRFFLLATCKVIERVVGKVRTFCVNLGGVDTILEKVLQGTPVIIKPAKAD